MVVKDTTAYCNYTGSLKQWIETGYWGTYNILMPFYFFLAFTGRSLSLLAFYHQAKIESAYLFQIFVAVVELVEVFSFPFYTTLRFLWSGVARFGESWFMSCWFCMFFDAHFTNPMKMAAEFCTLLLSLCLTLDRIYALAKPVKYGKKKNRKRQQWSIFLFCIFISFVVPFPVVFYFDPVWKEGPGLYNNILNGPWHTILLSLVNLHTATKLVLTLVLIVSDAILAIIYRSRIKKRANIPNRNQEQQAEEIEKVRVLFWLTFIQSILASFFVFGEFVYQLTNWLCSVFLLGDADCISAIITPFCTGIRALADVADFYIVFALMPAFRKMVIRSVKRVLKITNDEVTAISISGGVSTGGVTGGKGAVKDNKANAL